MSDWITDYIRYTAKHEAPDSFHRWTALTILGAAVGRRAWIDRGFYKLYPGQMMTIVVAGSAIMRKSTAIKIGERLLRKTGLVEIVTGKRSPEAFIDSLDMGSFVKQGGQVVPKDSHVLVFASELSSFLSKQAYTEALIPILTDLSDAPDKWDFRTRGHGATNLHNVCMGFLSASTPDWLADAIPANSFGGGFMSRIIFVYEEKTTRVNAMPEKEDLDVIFETKLVEELKQIAQQANGQIHLSDAAKEFFVEWYTQYILSSEGQLDGYWGRRPDHMLRVSLITTLAQGRFQIQVEDIIQADEWLKLVEATMPQAFKFVGATAMSKEHENIVKIFRKAGGDLSLRELMNLTWRRMDVNIVRQAIDTLKTAGIIHEEVHGSETLYTLKNWDT